MTCASAAGKNYRRHYRVEMVVIYMGWVDLNFARLYLGRWEFGRIGCADGQDGGTSKLKSTPTQVTDHHPHPVDL